MTIQETSAARDVAAEPPAQAKGPRNEFVAFLKDLPIGLIDLAIHYGLRLLPIDWCSHIGIYLGLFARLRYPESDARAKRAWQTLRPDEAGPEQTEAALKRLWCCVGRTMAEYSVLGRMWPKGRIEVEGVEHLDAARAAGKPRLVMGMHLGNWETIPPTLIGVGHPGSGIYLPPDNRFDHWIAVKVRERYGAKLVPPGPNTTREALKALKEDKGIFIIFADEFVRGRVHAPAFGRPLSIQGSNVAYVARLAQMTGAAVIPAYCERIDGKARFKVRFLPPVDLQQSRDKKADVAENVARLDAVMDPIIRAHLDQWFYVLDFDFNK